MGKPGNVYSYKSSISGLHSPLMDLLVYTVLFLPVLCTIHCFHWARVRGFGK